MQQRTTRRVVTQTEQATQSRAELDGLTMQRAELQMQMEQLSKRRNQLDEQRRVTSNGPAQARIEAQMAEIDARSARIDGQLQTLNDRIVDAMGRVSAPRQVTVDVPRVIVPQISVPPFDGMFRQRGPDMRQIGGIMAAEAITLALIGVVFFRFGMKRMRDQFERLFAQQSTQMNQLQQAVDVIGIEVERISEGQRYVAKMLTDGSPAAMSAGRKDASAAPVMKPRDG